MTTPAPSRDVTELFPGIEAYARTATRLHPVPGRPAPGASHIGGPLLWPAGEPWPVCAAEHLVPVERPVPEAIWAEIAAARQRPGYAGYAEAIAKLAAEIPGFEGVNRRTRSALGREARAEPTPLVPVAQLRAADVPDLAAPAGADLLQVLWCPNDHDAGEGLAPAVSVRWRAEAAVGAVLPAPPAANAGQPRYVPRPCVLRPERVVEYPWWQELPPDLGAAVRAWDRDHRGRYHRQLATAPGWKVGGHTAWPTTDPTPAWCPRCGGPLAQLLQIDSNEWGDALRWRPLEAGPDADPEPTGVVAGLNGLCRLLTCPACLDRSDAPVRLSLQ
jgi:hypothetical protein